MFYSFFWRELSSQGRRRANTASRCVRNLLSVAKFLVSVSLDETPSGDTGCSSSQRLGKTQRNGFVLPARAVCCSDTACNGGETAVWMREGVSHTTLTVASIILQLVKKFRLNEAWNSYKNPYFNSILNHLNHSRNFRKLWLHNFSKLIPFQTFYLKFRMCFHILHLCYMSRYSHSFSFSNSNAHICHLAKNTIIINSVYC